jgi:hypothetical protein
MTAVTLTWSDWRRVIATLRDSAIPSMLAHADLIEQRLETHGPGEATVTLTLNDDVYLRSYNWARWQLGIPLPPERAH